MLEDSNQSAADVRRVSFLERGAHPMKHNDVKYRLTIPIEDAFAFAMGEFDLADNPTCDAMRQLVGVLVVDALQYGEHWRVAAEARAFLARRWPECPGFRGSDPE